MRRIFAGWILLAVITATPLAFSQEYVTETGSAVPEIVPAAGRELIAQDAIALKSHDTVVAEFWMRTVEFEGEPGGGFGVRYDMIPEGAYLGVVSFPEKGSDFREQSIPSGIYSLRYGLHPENGDHMGVASSRDFAILSPVDKDVEAMKNYEFEALMKLTSEVGNPHPTVARLELPEGDDAPNLWEDDYENWVLDLAVADAVIGIVVDGHAEE